MGDKQTDIEMQEYKDYKMRQRMRFQALQNLPYEVKKRKAAERIHEFVREMDKRGYNCHVSVGGLDSITLLLFIRSLGYNIPAISVSNVENRDILPRIAECSYLRSGYSCSVVMRMKMRV